MNVERSVYRVVCPACGHAGEVTITSNEWGRVGLRWIGFAPLRAALSKPWESAARFLRCGSDEARVAPPPPPPRQGRSAPEPTAAPPREAPWSSAPGPVAQPRTRRPSRPTEPKKSPRTPSSAAAAGKAVARALPPETRRSSAGVAATRTRGKPRPRRR